MRRERRKWFTPGMGSWTERVARGGVVSLEVGVWKEGRLGRRKAAALPPGRSEENPRREAAPAVITGMLPGREFGSRRTLHTDKNLGPAYLHLLFYSVSVCVITKLFVNNRSPKMKVAFGLCVVLVAICAASAFPQKDGAIFSNEAIKQAQSTFLIPKDAQIQKVQEGIEVAAYENIKGDESINLFQILGDQVPPEVVSNLQAQVEQIGKN